VRALDATPSAGLVVRIGNARPVTTDSLGQFEAEVSATGLQNTVVSASSIVERQTTVSIPATDPIRLSLIPASFDLAAFDEMFRASNGRLQRWTTAPSLVILGSVMSMKGGSGGSYSATGDQMSEDEVSEMITHLTEGLSLLTGGSYAAFARIDVERPAEGDRVTVWREGTIVTGRYDGVVSTAGTIGFGQWAEEPDGTISGGAMFLDREFDRVDSRRRLVRIHELGHALGYQHVTLRPSIMNPAVGSLPSDFDRDAAVVAFQRLPGNRSPDIDPSPTPAASVTSRSQVRWSAPAF
jgi:hypothetical protein